MRCLGDRAAAGRGRVLGVPSPLGRSGAVGDLQRGTV